MLCGRCQTRIPTCFNHDNHSRSRRLEQPDYEQDERHNIDVRPTFSLHGRLDAGSFYESIKLGCFICRHVWHSLLDWRQSLCQGEPTSEPRHKTVVWHTFEDFSNEMADITHLLTERGFNATKLLASGISFCGRVIYSNGAIRGIYMLGPQRGLSGPVEGPSEDSLWQHNFFFSRARGEDARGAWFPAPHFRTLSSSTSSVPQLWNHWIRTCQEKHVLCRSLGGSHNFQPKRLVRIIPPLDGKAELKWCLAFPGVREPVEYVTLSHCWGSHQPYRLTDGNIHHIQRESRADVLPKTYRDAFDVALALGCRHIWIDSLCIIQGNQQDWLEQSPQMASIYGGALCNIAATWASDGTEGCFNTRDPFTVAGATISLGEPAEQYHVTPGWLYDCDFHRDAPLNGRGWVVQERCLSTRQLSFTKNQVYWECAELFASEQFPNGLPEDVWKEGQRWLAVSHTTPKPTLNHSLEVHNRQAWCSLVNIFSRCALTHASDKMMALASLARALRQRTRDVYLAGLWKQDLQKQLVWKVLHGRRPEIYHAPSWSWASVDGSIEPARPYFDTPEDVTRIEIVDIMSATVESDDPDALHSFTAGELRMRAVVTSVVCNIDNRGRSSIDESSYCHQPGTEVGLNVDSQRVDNEVRVQLDSWEEIDSNEQSSEFLLVFLSCIINRRRSFMFEGLVLLEVKDEAGEQKFKRVGTFDDLGARWPCHPLAFRLGMDPRAKSQGGFQISLDDPRLADLVRVVTVI